MIINIYFFNWHSSCVTCNFLISRFISNINNILECILPSNYLFALYNSFLTLFGPIFFGSLQINFLYVSLHSPLLSMQTLNKFNTRSLQDLAWHKIVNFIVNFIFIIFILRLLFKFNSFLLLLLFATLLWSTLWILNDIWLILDLIIIRISFLFLDTFFCFLNNFSLFLNLWFDITIHSDQVECIN